jgi:cell division initiation protein
MKNDDETPPAASSSSEKPRLTPLDVQQKEFRVSFRGYSEREVDEFLDLVTEELQRYEGEIMRLRSERVAADPSSFDLDAEGERFLAGARERAEAIVRDAEARAAGIPTASASEARAVVAPYLNREREFLERLGSLVQGHARAIKTMVEEARRRTEAPTETSFTPPSAPAIAAAANGGDAAAGSSAPEIGSADVEEDVVVLESDDPVSSRTEQNDADRETGGGRSLRELFWGED